MIAHRPLLGVAAGCVVATAFGVAAGQGSTVALASALVLAAAIAAATALRLRPARRGQPALRLRESEMPARLRHIAGVMRESTESEFAVDRSLRPLLAPIAAARLGRRGVDMALAPGRAQELLGDVLWDIVRPDRPAAVYRVGRGLAEDDLRTAIGRLEQL